MVAAMVKMANLAAAVAGVLAAVRGESAPVAPRVARLASQVRTEAAFNWARWETAR
jgi:hypothetical protein